MDAFPPRRSDELDDRSSLLLSALSSVIEHRTAIYVAGPITNGPRYATWKQTSGAVTDETAHRLHVVGPNVADGERAVRELRKRAKGPVISPFSLLVKGWTQGDYRHFWSTVIESLVFKVVLIDGWAWSGGASYEVLVGLSSLCLIENQEGEPITASKAWSAVSRSIEELKKLDLDVSFLESVNKGLHLLSAGSS